MIESAIVVIHLFNFVSIVNINLKLFVWLVLMAKKGSWKIISVLFAISLPFLMFLLGYANYALIIYFLVINVKYLQIIFLIVSIVILHRGIF